MGGYWYTCKIIRFSAMGKPTRDYPRVKLTEAISEVLERLEREEIGLDDFPEEFMKLNQRFPGIGFDVEAAKLEQQLLKRRG